MKGNVLQAERQRMIVAEANRIAVLNAASPRYGQCNRQAPQLFEQLACNVNFLWEGVREGYLFLKKRYPSLIRIPCAAQGMDAALRAANFVSLRETPQPGGQVMSRPART